MRRRKFYAVRSRDWVYVYRTLRCCREDMHRERQDDNFFAPRWEEIAGLSLREGVVYRLDLKATRVAP